MREVAILGIGQIKIGEHWDKSLREIGGEAAFAAMQDAGMDKVDSLYVGNMLSPIVSGQNQLGTFCGIINIYNFLSDSFKYNRESDLGYLVGRIFINKTHLRKKLFKRWLLGKQ